MHDDDDGGDWAGPFYLDDPSTFAMLLERNIEAGRVALVRALRSLGASDEVVARHLPRLLDQFRAIALTDLERARADAFAQTDPDATRQ